MNNFQIILLVFGVFGGTAMCIGFVLKSPLVTSFGLVVGIFVVVFATSDDLPRIGLINSKENCYASGKGKSPNDTDIVTPARMRAQGCMQLQPPENKQFIRMVD